MESVTRLRKTFSTTDAYGLPIYSEGSTTFQAAVTSRTTSKTVGASEITITDGITLYLPGGTDVKNDDVFVVRGKRYQVDGEAFNWVSGLGSWNPGVVVDLRRDENG
jgi:SPP1 family predicted phage head-tail adaptor